MSELARPRTTVELFEASAETYDRVNTVISLGMDRGWRRWVARQAMGGQAHPSVFDAFAGTGLAGLEAAAMGARVTLADESAAMLAVARRRAGKRRLDARFECLDLSAAPLDVPGAPFDAATVVFGVRYLDDPAAVLARIAGELRPGGRLVVLEFCEPGRGLLSRLAGFYFFRIIPWLAGLLAGDRELYDTLARTTHAMGPAEHLSAIVRDAGLDVVETRTMGFGLVAGVVGVRR